MSNEALRETFFAECEELIESLTEDLDIVAGGDWDGETINAIFRAVHSIKGAAGAFGFEDLVSFAHKYETVLDLIRSDKLEITSDVLRLITRSADTLAELVDCSRVEGSSLPGSIESLAAELEAITGGAPEAEVKAEEEFVFAPLNIITDLDLPPLSHDFSIHFKPEASLYLNGHEPSRFIAALSKLGDLEAVADFDSVPQLDSFDFDVSYLGWTFVLRGAESEADIEDVFAFVDGLCTLTITQLDIDPITPNSDPEVSTEGEEDVPQSQVPQPQVEASKATPSPAKQQSTLRVDPERVDRLINSVGELIINQAVINQNLKDSGLEITTEIMATLEDYGTLARDIQEAVMSIRAQPVKSLFQRMGRVVREAAEATQKSVVFTSEGEATEIDKTMLERLADPLTHMLRNAVDHGIEPPSERVASGKSETGLVKLSAAHRSGNVVIEIQDDGAGLNRDRLLAKAIEKGIVAPDSKLSDGEIDALLFAPGFSTAENVTNLSGRGVGMDVVKTAITSLGGRVGITSNTGKGSTFTISLPLTLAVMDGMIVQVGSEIMVIPLSSVIETVRAQPKDIRETTPGEMVLAVRGAFVPIIDLGFLLGLTSEHTKSCQRTFVLVDTNGSTTAISLDAIDDQRQVVIKSLEGNYGSIAGISAATILGDGKIALIIDPEALPDLENRRRAKNEKPSLENQF